MALRRKSKTGFAEGPPEAALHGILACGRLMIFGWGLVDDFGHWAAGGIPLEVLWSKKKPVKIISKVKQVLERYPWRWPHIGF